MICYKQNNTVKQGQYLETLKTRATNRGYNRLSIYNLNIGPFSFLKIWLTWIFMPSKTYVFVLMLFTCFTIPISDVVWVEFDSWNCFKKMRCPYSLIK